MDKLSNLDKRLIKLEKKFHITNKKTSKVTNEIAISPILKTIAPVIIKFLPQILEAIPELIKFYKERDIDNSNAEKIDILNKLGQIKSDDFEKAFADDSDLIKLAQAK